MRRFRLSASGRRSVHRSIHRSLDRALGIALGTETKPKISAAEMERRRGALGYAVSHNRIEGQFPDPEGAALFDAFVCGEIDKPELRQRLHALNFHS